MHTLYLLKVHQFSLVDLGYGIVVACGHAESPLKDENEECGETATHETYQIGALGGLLDPQPK